MNPRQAVIVCHEVATKRAPILLAVRSEPEDSPDSGWQFLRGEDEEDREVQKFGLFMGFSSLVRTWKHISTCPVETTLKRNSVDADWQVAFNRSRDENPPGNTA
jgi:hypothetical protein